MLPKVAWEQATLSKKKKVDLKHSSIAKLQVAIIFISHRNTPSGFWVPIAVAPDIF